MQVDILIRDCHLACMTQGGAPYGAVHDGALAIRGEQLVYVGRAADLPANLQAAQTVALHGAWVTPGLIDCHTHAVFAGDRADEFEQRLSGVSYSEIARAGGGILGSVRKTRAASLDELTASAATRLRMLAADGVTTVEIKSGYGLDLDSERRMLLAGRAAAAQAGLAARSTYLALHALPPEMAREQFVRTVCEQWLPRLHSEGLVDAVDAFCEGIAFTSAECAALFAQARELGIPVKLHADQLSDGGGAACVARYGGLSADHVEYTSAAGISAMAQAGTVAVLLPAAFVMLGETTRPPVPAFRAASVPMAVATDLNPGTSPMLSLRLAAALACSVFGLTPEESLRGITVEAARALGLTDRGQLLAGQRADLAVWNITQPAELCYWMGGNLLKARMLAGQWTVAE